VIEYSEIDRNKLNPEFAARLNQFAPDQKIRVIVLLQVGDTGSLAGKRQSRMERQAAIQSVHISAANSLAHIDGIIQHFDGRFLVEHPNLLGSLPIEINAAGINALTKSDAVKAVMEDRSVFQILDNY
jgi:hypothetical protein